MKASRVMTCPNGFTLVELLIVMAVFIIILMISASAFENAFKVCSGVSKSAQSEIEGIVGLDFFRKDLNAAGYGLPWSWSTGETSPPIVYMEADLKADNPIVGLSADDFNDAPSNLPRAVVSGTVPKTKSTILESAGMDTIPGSDYLVIKSTLVAINNSVGKWGFVNYSGNQTSNLSYIAKMGTSEDLSADDVVVTHMSTFSGTNQAQHVLAMRDASNYSYTLAATDSLGHFLPPDASYMPSGSVLDPFGIKVNNEKMIVYALKNGKKDSTVRMPFNRADYFIRRPSTAIPARCNPGTGILYKSVIINSTKDGGGGRTLYPLLDCVGDMQVVFYLQDASDSSKTYPSDTLTTLSAEEIRNQLKAIKVYLLVQEGGKDMSYSYPFSDSNNVITIADSHNSSLGRVFTESDMIRYFGSDWNRYRWKVYTVSGQPYNLVF